MDSCTKKLQIEAPIKKVYEAISTQKGVASWWSEDYFLASLKKYLEEGKGTPHVAK